MMWTTAKRSCVRSSLWLALITLLAAAGAFRFYGLNWDQQIGAHPDERYIVGIASRLSFPRALNPFDAAPHLAYGHLPLYLLAVARLLVPRVDPLLLGRALSASFDLGTVIVTFALGRQLLNTRVGLLSASFVGLMVAHVQQAHFYTPDTLLTFFVLGALLFAVRFVQDGEPRDAWLAGGAAGLAMGTKAAAGLLVVPLSVACALRPNGGRRALWRCGVAAAASFLVLDPFALIELPTYLQNLARQGAIVRGVLDMPYTRQYHGTLPYIYPIVQQLRWGMGWLMGSCGFAGLVYEAVQAVRRPPRSERWMLLAWVIPYFAFVGGLYAKFPRYLLPIVPLLAVYAAQLVSGVGERRRPLVPILSAAVLGALLLRCLALTAMYRAPHPWTIASEWIHGHAEPGSTIAVEAWDHPLPVDATDYVLLTLPIFEEETPTKWKAIETGLEQVDYLIVASRRGYGSLARWPDRFGRTVAYYERLFAGDLGFECVACFERHPRLGPLALVDDPVARLPFSLPKLCQDDAGEAFRLGRLDESFVVYDHPLVMVFRAHR